METKYQNRERLLEMSSVIEDAPYEVGYSSRENLTYAMGNSKCGSKCSSRSSRSTARGRSLTEKVSESPVNQK